MFDKELSLIKINSSVVMRIMKHAMTSPNKIASGQLLGLLMENGEKLEITYCYPVPNKDEIEQEETEKYERELTQKFDEVQLDNYQVGWYLISHQNDFLQMDQFNAHYEYQKQIPFAVMVVYDGLEAECGNKMPIKVFRIKKKIMQILQKSENSNGQVDLDSVKNLSMQHDSIYEQLDFQIDQNPLVRAFIKENIRSIKKNQEHRIQQFNKSGWLEQNTKLLIDTLEELDTQELRLNEDFLKENKIKLSEKNSYDAESYLDFLITQKKVTSFSDKTSLQANLLRESQQLLESGVFNL